MTELTIKQNEKMESMLKNFNYGVFKMGRIAIENINYALTCYYKLESGKYAIIAEYILMRQSKYFEIGLSKKENTRVRNIFELACYKLLQYIASSFNDEDDE